MKHLARSRYSINSRYYYRKCHMTSAGVCWEHPVLKDYSDSEDRLLPQLQCVRPRLLPGTSVEGCGEGRDVWTSGRHAERPPCSTGLPARVCARAHAVKLGIQAMSQGKRLITRPRSSNRCHGNGPSSLFQEVCSREEERSRQLWPFLGVTKSQEHRGRRPPP